MYQVILNADDLGYSPAVNRAILHTASSGTLTAASLMVNMPFAEEAVKAVQESLPNLSLGLHFCLTSGRSVASAEQIPLLVDSDGCFRHGFLGLWRLLCSRRKNEVLEQIQTEFNAQLERTNQFAFEYGLRFDHLDSHQHVHVFSEVFDILDGEAQKRNLVLRVPRERLGSGKRILYRFFTWVPSGLFKKGILDYHLRVRPSTLGWIIDGRLRKRMQMVGYYGILDTGKMDKQALLHIFDDISRNSSEEVYEINIHPSEEPLEQGLQTKDSSPGDVEFHRSQWRQREYATLLDPELKAIIEQKGIQLVGFSNHQNENNHER